jgi:hypothetical protein
MGFGLSRFLFSMAITETVRDPSKEYMARGGTKMSLLSRTFSRCVGMLLVCALVAPAAAFAAPRGLTPEKVHAHIMKRGLGNWVGVEVSSGAAFAGRIVNIDDESFGLQLHNDPGITQVQYSDVIDLRTGISSGGGWAILAAGVGGTIALALVAHHEMSQMPKLPTLPNQPILP